MGTAARSPAETGSISNDKKIKMSFWKKKFSLHNLCNLIRRRINGFPCIRFDAFEV